MGIKRVTWIGTAAVLALFWLAVEAAASAHSINRSPDATPPQPVSASIAAGETLYIRVPNDNFQWYEVVTNEQEGLFTPEIIDGLQLKVYGYERAAGYLDDPVLSVQNGNLYILALALKPVDGLEYPVGIEGKDGRRVMAVCTQRITITEPVSSGNGGDGDGGDSGGNGSGEAGSGKDEGDDGSGGGMDGGKDGGGNSGGDSGSGSGEGGSGSGGSGPGGGGSGGDGGAAEAGSAVAGVNPGFSLGLVELALSAGEDAWIPLPPEAFLWKNTAGEIAPPRGDALPTLSGLQGAGVRMSFTHAAASPKVVREAVLEQRHGTVGITLRTQQQVLALQDAEFSGVITLYDDAARVLGDLAGLLAVDTIYLEAAGTAVSLENMAVVEALADLRDVELYLGGGVYLHADLKQGRRYAGLALRAEGDGGAGLESVCTLYLLGFEDAPGVRIEDNAVRYVYDEAGAYLGNTGRLLPLRDTYYIYSVYTGAEPEVPTERGRVYAGDGGKDKGSSVRDIYAGDLAGAGPGALFQEQAGGPALDLGQLPDPYSENINDNPSTGREA